jgi:hypothetical protein
VLLLPPIILLLLGKPASQLASPQFHPLFSDFKHTWVPAVKYAASYGVYTGVLALLAATAAGDFTFSWMKQTWSIGCVGSNINKCIR